MIQTMKNRSLVSIDDFTTDEILRILDLAEEFEKDPVSKLLEGKVIATLFFEPSTRTRLSFESAINRLGGKIVGFADSSSTSVSKGETLNDTIRTVSNYCDLIVMRHPIEGSARFASEISNVPVINAGDGANQHPSQTLLDLYSIRKTQGTLENLNIFMVGDLKYGRTVHSLMMAMSRWNATFNFISPEELKMPDEFKLYLDNLGLKYYEHSDFTDIISKADIIYMTRVQKERFSDPIDYEKVKNVYVLRNEMLRKTKPNMRILHPLPRVNEIHQDVDSNEKAYYFEQALNGVFTRQAILCSLLGIK
jgi:aspartate carbamoyltransferase catalytic subunit